MQQRGRPALNAGYSRHHGPEIALLALLVATASIGFNQLPALSLGVTLEVPDILLLGSLSWIAVRWLTIPGFRFVRTPLDRPLLIFFAVTLMSTVLAIVHGAVDIDITTQALRVFSFYLTFFIVTNLVREARQLTFLVNGMFLLGTLIALAMIAQYVSGGSVQLIRQQVSPNELGQSITFGDAVRIAPPGVSVIMVSFVAMLCILVCQRFKAIGLVRFAQCGLLGMALILTFFRSYWLALIVVIPLASLVVRGKDRRRLIGWAMAVMFPASLLLLAVIMAPTLPISRLLNTSWNKLSSVVDVQAFRGGDASYSFRMLENEYAFSAIAAHPVIGLGLGASYRPLDPRLDGRDRQGVLMDRTAIIHNGHLRILLQSGLAGYLSFLWLSLAFLLRGFKNWRNVPNDRMGAVVLGFSLVYLALLIAAGANSIFMQSYWIPVIGIIMGINEVIFHRVEPSMQSNQKSSGR